MHAMLKVLINNAKAGSNVAAIAVLDRGFGKPTQSVEMKIDGGLITKKLSELSAEELAALDERLTALGLDQSDMFPDFDPDAHGPH